MQKGRIKEKARFRKNRKARNESEVGITEIEDCKQAQSQPSASGNAKGLSMSGPV